MSSDSSKGKKRKKMSEGVESKKNDADSSVSSSDSGKGKKRKKEMNEDGPKRKKLSLRLLDDSTFFFIKNFFYTR